MTKSLFVVHYKITLFFAFIRVVPSVYNRCALTKIGFTSALIVATLVAVAVRAEAQRPKKVPRIGYLYQGDRSSDSTRIEAIRLALRELGYIEGQNIAIEYRYAEGKRGRESELAAELVRLKVDLILVAGGGDWIQAAKNAFKTIPIVMTGTGGDPVAAGLVESLARPGGNVTGLTNLSAELGRKRLELLKEVVPKVARVAVLYNPTSPSSVREVKEDLPVAARALGLTVQTISSRAQSPPSLAGAAHKCLIAPMPWTEGKHWISDINSRTRFLTHSLEPKDRMEPSTTIGRRHRSTTF